MKPILTLAVAAAMAFTGQPIYAAHGKHQHGGGHAQMQRAAMAAARPQMAHQAPRPQFHARNVAPRSHAFAAQNRVRPQQRAARVAQRNSIIAQQRARNQASFAARQRANVVAQQRIRNHTNFAARNRATRIRNHSIAFGGNRTVNNRVDIRNRSYYRPPVEVYRDWDRGRVHSWNNHRYHWYDGAWVVIDAGPNYYYDTEPSVVISGGSGDLVAQVQAALDHRGYNAGPVDGVAGAQTRDAIAAFQDDHGLAVTGDINHALLRNLGL